MKKFTVAAVILSAVCHAGAVNYSFTKIADDADGTFTSFIAAGSVNAAGTVAFNAFGSGSTAGIYTGAGGSIHTVEQGLQSAVVFPFGPAINNNGAVAYLKSSVGVANYVIYDDAVSPVVVATADGSGSFINVNQPSLNNNGAVFYGASFGSTPPLDGGFSLYKWAAGATTELYHASATSTPFIALSTAGGVNDSDLITFTASTTPTIQGIFKGNGGPTTSIATAESGNPLSTFAMLSPFPALNNSAVAVFYATSPDGKTGVYSGNGGPLTTYADTTGPYSSIHSNIAISDGGIVAFRADTDSLFADGPNGIFTGPTPATDRVIRIGDELFSGYYVTDLFYDGAINEHGQIAFRYTVQSADFLTTRHGIALATPDSSAPALSSILQMNVGGGPGVVGGMQATFDAITQDGRFSADFFRPDNTADLTLRIGDDAAGAVDFNLATPDYQLWNLEFSGVFTGDADLVFHYDDAGLLVDESLLRIRHFVNGQWEIPGQSLDTVNNTITLAANSFSPFILTGVPEPSSAVLLGLGIATLLGRRASRHSRRAAGR